MITSAPPHCVTWFVQCDNLFVSFSWDLQKVRRTLVHTRYIPIAKAAKATSFLAPSGNQSGSAHDDKLVSNSSKMYSHSNWKALVCTCQSLFGGWLHFFSIFNHILELISILFQIGWSHQPDIFYVISYSPWIPIVVYFRYIIHFLSPKVSPIYPHHSYSCSHIGKENPWPKLPGGHHETVVVATVSPSSKAFFLPAGGGGNHWDVDDVPFGYLT